VYCSRIHDVDQLKSRLIEEWKHLHQVLIDETIRQWCPIFELAFEHMEDILNTLVMFDICIDVHFFNYTSVRLPIVDTFVLG